MTFQHLGSRALFAGAFLTGWLLAAPVQAEPTTKADSQGLEQAVSRVKQALGEAEENGKVTPPVEHAVYELLQTFGRRRRGIPTPPTPSPGRGNVRRGYDQAGDLTTTSTNSPGSRPRRRLLERERHSGASPEPDRQPRRDEQPHFDAVQCPVEWQQFS